MAFYGYSFSYDNVFSETYGLYLSAIDGEGVSTSSGNYELDIINQKIYRKTRPYFYGATSAGVLSFPITAHSKDELTAIDFSLIQEWLFSSRSYKVFRVFQPDMTDVYFNVIFNSPEIIRVGNLIVGFTAQTECDSPFGYISPKAYNYTFTGQTVDQTIVIENLSDDKGEYIYPKVLATLNTFGGTVSIINESDANREFKFVGITANESISVDNYTQIITSSTGVRRLSKFNKGWLRLVPGKNVLRIQGNISALGITTQFVAKKIGG